MGTHPRVHGYSSESTQRELLVSNEYKMTGFRWLYLRTNVASALERLRWLCTTVSQCTNRPPILVDYGFANLLRCSDFWELKIGYMLYIMPSLWISVRLYIFFSEYKIENIGFQLIV